MTETRQYSFDPGSRIWATPCHNDITYSDGDVVEQGLLKALRQCVDVGCTSDEIRAHIVDWPSEYHLSQVRHNLLRPFAFKPADRILELGCGCGAITRYLGECGATVVAVEGSHRRATIAAERCRDLPNVSVYCDNIIDFQSHEPFDYVMMIGVLEYSPLFGGTDDPVKHCLQRARSFLKEGGTLFVAIENKLGLKYFSGCHEDHVGTPYFGINDLYASDTPITFGKAELANHLGRSGFQSHEFFYPFPDYKLPYLILSEAGADSKKLNLADLLVHHVSRDYHDNNHRAFAEGLAWGPVAANGLLGDMANSFLVCAFNGVGVQSRAGWLAKIFSRSHRKKEFLMETTIEPEVDGSLAVRKHFLVPEARQNQSMEQPFRHVPMGSNYIHGGLLLRDIQIAIVRERSLAEIVARFAPWLAWLRAHAVPGNAGKLMLPGNFLDCIPANLIVDDAGKIKFFDAEWVVREDIPMSWVLVRGIVYAIHNCLSSRVLAGMTDRQLIEAIIGHELDDNECVQADMLERKFMKYCHVHGADEAFLLDFMDGKLNFLERLSDNPVRAITLLAYKADLARVKNTVSWRITAPLRVIWNLCLRLIGKTP